MERNSDKIKRLEQELGRYQKKVADQSLEIAKLRGQLDTYRDGLAETHKAANALCIAVALKYGTEVAPGTTEAALPKIYVEELLGEYEVTADERTREYIISARERGE